MKEKTVALLDSYGKAITSYIGSGSLQLNDGVQIDCRFELVQTSQGRVVALCQRDDRDLYLSPPDGRCQLEGEVEDGRRLECAGVRVLRSSANTKYDESGETSHSYVVVSADWVTIEAADKPDGPIRLSFALTNFTLLGTDSYQTQNPDGSSQARRQLPLTLGPQEAVIRPLSDYSEIVRELEASRGTDVTSELLTTAASIHQLDEAIRLADDLCWLLTLARGCRVEWLCYDAFNSAGELLSSYHRNAITKRWGSLQLIATDPPEDTKFFLERTYQILQDVQAYWGFRDAVSAYTDGKTEGDFLEFRALKLAVTMEYLVARYLAQVDSVHILPEKDFKAELTTLTQEVRDALTERFPKATPDQVSMLASHAQGFNWYTFRRALSDICRELGLGVNSTQRDRFKMIRDELVHRASFHPKLGSPWQQYSFMMTFIGKVLLAILSYDGYYYDWTVKPGWIGKDMEMRVKLELKHGKKKQE